MKSNFTTEYEAFRSLIIKARKEGNLTQDGLAKLLNKPQSYVAKYENGERRLDVIEFLLIAKALNADPIEIIKELTSLEDK